MFSLFREKYCMFTDSCKVRINLQQQKSEKRNESNNFCNEGSSHKILIYFERSGIFAIIW